MARKPKKYEVYRSYYRRQLKNILRVLRKWEGLPDSVFEPALNELLLFRGYAVMYEYKGEIIVSDGSLQDFDIYKRPVKFESANPLIVPSVKKTIGKNCVVFYNSPNYFMDTPKNNMNEIIEIYASRMADLAISFDQSVRNSRVCIIPLVDDDKEAIRVADTLARMYDGEPVAIAYKTGFDSKKDNLLFPIKARDNLIVADLQDALNTCLDNFYHDIGVKGLAVDKKERVTVGEQSSDDQKLYLAQRALMDPIDIACKQAKEIFGLDISCEYNLPEEVMLYETEEKNSGQTAVDNKSESPSDVRE